MLSFHDTSIGVIEKMFYYLSQNMSSGLHCLWKRYLSPKTINKKLVVFDLNVLEIKKEVLLVLHLIKHGIKWLLFSP